MAEVVLRAEALIGRRLRTIETPLSCHHVQRVRTRDRLHGLPSDEDAGPESAPVDLSFHPVSPSIGSNSVASQRGYARASAQAAS